MTKPAAIAAATAPLRVRPLVYPAVFDALTTGREKRPLGDFFGLKNFGVNLALLPPGRISSFHHGHSVQDELIYVVEGEPVLITDAGETPLKPGMCAGFPAGGTAHHLVNRSDRDVVYLEIGDRNPGDSVRYPDDDVAIRTAPDGSRYFTRKDGTAY